MVVVLFNNGAFGNVRRDQQAMFSGRLIGADLHNPDFVALAAGFGVPARRVRAPDELHAALAAFLKEDGPSLTEVVVEFDMGTSPWPFIQPGR